MRLLPPVSSAAVSATGGEEEKGQVLAISTTQAESRVHVGRAGQIHALNETQPSHTDRSMERHTSTPASPMKSNITDWLKCRGTLDLQR